MKRLTLVVVLAVGVLTTVTAAAAGDNSAGFHTSVPKMLQGKNGATTQAIISVGDTVEGHTFDSIPDGISISKINGKGTFDILVNHELSPVPFPATRQDYANALVAKLRLHQHSAGVLKGEYAIPSAAGYQRFCSNFLVSDEHGFERDLLFTNEEARDIVLRQQDSWHQPGVSLNEPGAEQAGVVVAYDVKSGAYRSIYGMGRHNHENSVGVPGYGYPVVLSGDDTFDAPASQLYLYKAASGRAVWNDEGKLYAFRSTDPAINDYGDIVEGMNVPGTFVEVPRTIATGKKANGTDIRSTDFPMPGVWNQAVPPPPAGIPDGPQWVLEVWSNAMNVFQFIRIEDTAYDRTNPRIHYLADSGEPRAIPNPATGRLMRGPSGTQGPYPNGRLWKLVLGAEPLTAVLSIAPKANYDLLGYRTTAAVHQLDNIESTKDAVWIQEDPGSHQNFPGATNARIWRYDIASGESTVVAEVDQSMSPITTPGAWESSGIVDASEVLGPGAFLVDVQAHGWDTPVPGGNDAPAVQQREHGQLLVLRVPVAGGGAAAAAADAPGKSDGKGKGRHHGHERGKGVR